MVNLTAPPIHRRWRGRPSPTSGASADRRLPSRRHVGFGRDRAVARLPLRVERRDGSGKPVSDSTGVVTAAAACVLEKTTPFDLRRTHSYISRISTSPSPTRPVNSVQLHELAGFLERFLLRREVDDREAAHDFLRLGGAVVTKSPRRCEFARHRTSAETAERHPTCRSSCSVGWLRRKLKPAAVRTPPSSRVHSQSSCS